MREEKKRGRKRIEKHRITTAVIYSGSARFLLVLLSSTLLVIMFSETMLLPALPEIMQDFNIPYSTAAWIFSAYLIVAAVMTPIAGKLSDIYGNKKILLILLILYVVGVVAGGFSENISFLLASRIIQGVGLAAVPVAFSIIRNSFPPEKLSMPVGVFSSAASGGSVVGLLIGASIIQNFGWHATFLFIAPAAVIVTFMIARFVPTDDKFKQQKEEQEHLQPSVNDNNSGEKNVINRRKSMIDIKGAIALSATITSFLIALTFIENSNSLENSIGIAGISFIVSAASLILFIFIEKRTKMPLIDLWLIKQRILLPTYVMMIVTGTTIFLVYPTIVQLVRSPQPAGFGGDAVYAAYVQLPFMLVFLIFSSATSYIISKLGKIMPTVLGSAISIAGEVGLLMLHSTGLLVSINLTIIAIGLALTMTAIWNLIVSSAPREFMGISTAIGALLSFIGMAIGPALAGTYMHTFYISIEGIAGLYPSPESFNMIFFTAAALSAVSLTFSLLLKRRTSMYKNIFHK
ncbi:MAG: MFS transporter [Nitrososphaeraceae archaeon]|nr:MFS transporter [Nitrososphaeraceae archaeon]